jgi:hypothetical protein
LGALSFLIDNSFHGKPTSNTQCKECNSQWLRTDSPVLFAALFGNNTNVRAEKYGNVVR